MIRGCRKEKSQNPVPFLMGRVGLLAQPSAAFADGGGEHLGPSSGSMLPAAAAAQALWGAARQGQQQVLQRLWLVCPDSVDSRASCKEPWAPGFLH